MGVLVHIALLILGGGYGYNEAYRKSCFGGSRIVLGASFHEKKCIVEQTGGNTCGNCR
jgi:hypothetical protein